MNTEELQKELAKFQLKRKNKGLTTNQKRSLSMRIKSIEKKIIESIPEPVTESIPEPVTESIPEQVLSYESNEFIDIVEDEYIPEESAASPTKPNKNQSHTEDILNDLEEAVLETKAEESQRLIDENPVKNHAVVEGMMFFKSIYDVHPELPDDFIHFSMKLRYFMMSENILESNITQRKLKKFIKLYPNYDIRTVAAALDLPYQ